MYWQHTPEQKVGAGQSQVLSELLWVLIWKLYSFISQILVGDIYTVSDVKYMHMYVWIFIPFSYVFFLRQWVVFSPKGHCESERFAVTWWVTSCTHSYYKFLCPRPHKISVVFKIDHMWDLSGVQTFLETLCVLVMLILREWVSLWLWVIGLKLLGEVLWPLLCMRSEQNDVDGLFQLRNNMKYCRGLVWAL